MCRAPSVRCAGISCCFEQVPLRLMYRRHVPRKFLMIERALLRSKVDVERGALLFAALLPPATLRRQVSAAAVVAFDQYSARARDRVGRSRCAATA